MEPTPTTQRPRLRAGPEHVGAGPDERSSRAARAAVLSWLVQGLVFTAVFVLVLAQLAPLGLTQPGAGLDPSWIGLMGEVAAGRYALGTDFTFTFGPLAPLYTRQFDPRTFGIYLGVSYALVAALSLALFELVVGSRNRLVAGCLIAVLATPLARDAVFLVAPLLFALLAVDEERGATRRTVFALLGALVSATLALVKFSVAPIAIVVLVAVDVTRLRRRELPISVLTAAFAYVSGFFLLAAKRSDLVTHLVGSMDASARFADAMGLRPPKGRLPLLGLLWAAASTSIVAATRRAPSAPPRRAHAIAVWCMVLGVAFVTFKAGFVRADDHMLTTFDALPLVVGGVLLSLRSSTRASIPAALAMLASTLVPSVEAPALGPWERVCAPTRAGLESVRDELVRTNEAIRVPASFVDRLRRQRLAAIAAVAETSPARGLRGTVASIPSIQSSFLAAGMDLRPFPSGQQYHAYSAWVIARDLAFIRSDRAPDYVAFAPEELDERYPALTEGPLWPELLARYEPVDERDGVLLLARRRARLSGLQGPVATRRGSLGAPLELPSTPSPVFLRIELARTFSGSVRSLLYKPPEVFLEATYLDGHVRRWRLVPAIAREGFVASPVVENDVEALQLFAGETRPRTVRSFTVVLGAAGRSAYRHEFEYSFQVLEPRVLAAARVGSRRFDEAASAASSRLELVRLLDADGGASSARRVTPRGLLLLAPGRLSVGTHGSSQLDLAFEIAPESYQGSAAPDGVCVRVRTREGAPLFLRCLEPRRRESDRGSQRASIDLGAGTEGIRIDTWTLGRPGWNAVYFGEIGVRRDGP